MHTMLYHYHKSPFWVLVLDLLLFFFQEGIHFFLVPWLI